MMLSIKEISYRYHHQDDWLYQDVSCELDKGHIYGLLGKNGVGKSTLLYLISGLIHPCTGQISLLGKAVTNRPVSVLEDFFLVPEEFDLPNMSIQNYLKNYGSFYPRFSEDDFNRYLGLFEMSSDLHLGRLSMGQKKKVFMAFALATNVSLLLLDEPTNGLDIPSKSQFRKLIASGMNEERTIVISTHQVRDIDKLIDDVLVLDTKGITLQTSLDKITDRLEFIETDDRSLVAKALYSVPSLYGNKLILLNDSEYKKESELDLELLFNALHEVGPEITALFNNSNDN